MAIELLPSKDRPPKRYTPEQKIKILKEWEDSFDWKGVAEKYNIHPSSLYNWKKQFDAGKETFLGPKTPKVEKKIKALEQEISKLKEVIVQQASELSLLKKSRRLD